MTNTDFKAWRERAGLSITEARKKLGLNMDKTLRDVEAGSREPDAAMLRKMREVYRKVKK